jgi:hypothetical protein
VQTKNKNINATDMFLAFAMVQQIMPELSGAATEKQKVAVITEAMNSLLKTYARKIHTPLKIMSFSAYGIGR